ncbi:MAG TPA: HAD-IB family phosphatase [bacterium]|nr:HAD-IB family phosphatase [bacterium]
MKPHRLILFDLDGTLTRGVSTTRFLFRRAGDEAFFRGLESRWMRDEVGHLALARQVTERMAGWRVRDLERSLERIPKMRGIGHTVRTLKARGFYVALATLGYELSAAYFQKRYGFDGAWGTTLQVRRGVITGRGMRIFQEHQKAALLKRLARRLRVPLSGAVAVGDSRSDREVFKVAGRRVALNQDGFLKGLADVDLRGDDLRRILGVL